MSKTKLMQVTWVIDVDAENAVDAARKALEIQRDLNSTAQHFEVKDLTNQKESSVDLFANRHYDEDGNEYTINKKFKS